MKLKKTAWLYVLLSVLVFLNTASAAFDYRVIAETGQPIQVGPAQAGPTQAGPAQASPAQASPAQASPATWLTFSQHAPVINNAGQVAFEGFFSGDGIGFSNNQALFLGSSSEQLLEVVREFDPAPDGPDGEGVFYYRDRFSRDFPFGPPSITDQGKIAFLGNTSSLNTQGIFLADGLNGVVQVARAGESAPDGNGVFDFFLGTVALNAAGQSAFSAQLTGTNEATGVFLGDGANPLQQLVRAGDTAPDGNGKFHGFFSHVVLSDAGEVAFSGALRETIGGSSDRSGIFRAGGASGLVQVARKGQALPQGGGFIRDAFFPILNNAGQLAFSSTFSDTVGGSFAGRGIFLSDSANPLITIARTGDAAPDGGEFSDIGQTVFNDLGQVAFVANLTDDTGVSRGIFTGTNSEDLLAIVRSGQLTPNGNGVFSSFHSLASNAQGQIVFVATLDGTDSSDADDFGLFLYDENNGLQEVLREGDELLGSTLANVRIAPSVGPNSSGLSSFNDAGEIVVRLTLADRQAIVVFSPVPEPNTLLLTTAMLSALAMTSRRRRFFFTSV